MNKSQSHDADIGEEAIWELYAALDLTKHLGGQAATEQLVELCQIDANKYVLDIGCGVGITPCNIVKSYGCKVVGVDLRETMIERSKARARRLGVEDLVEFRIADAQDLPFEDNRFDVVMAESVFAFIQDKSSAVRESVRVTKPGGFFGITEATWIESPPSSELLATLSRAFGPSFAILDAEGWKGLLAGAGLKDVIATSRGITVRSEAVNRFRRFGFKQMALIWLRALSVLPRSPEYRGLLKEALSDPKELIEYWGYGVYVGRK